MAKQQYLEILRQGVDVWNQWRQKYPDIQPDLRDVELRDAQLNKIDFHNTRLDRADLYRADLREANLAQADLYKADLWKATLDQANLHKADLQEAKLLQASLRGANLQEANLDQADLYRANAQDTDLRNANLHWAHLYGGDFSHADLSGAILRGADLVRSELVGTRLRQADLRWVKLSQANLSGADLTGSAVYGISAWDITIDEDALQSNLDITKEKNLKVTVDNLEVAQFIYMLLNYKKLRHVLNSVMEKGVLILGGFSNDRKELLYSIAEQLRNRSYLPIIFDFTKPESSSFTETVHTLAGLSRFVIADLSGQSVFYELGSLVSVYHIPFAPILDQGRNPSTMFSDLLRKDEMLPVFWFKDKDDLITSIETKIIKPAEEKRTELQQKYGERVQEHKQALLDNKQNNVLVKEKKSNYLMENELSTLPFQSFRKTTLLYARPLTEEDAKQRAGIIETLEGPTTFVPGDYLARGVQNEEWPISQEHFHKNYEQIAGLDPAGFASYRALDIRQACQMSEAFSIKRTNNDILTGKAGDYLVRSGSKIWIIDHDIFEKSYEIVF